MHDDVVSRAADLLAGDLPSGDADALRAAMRRDDPEGFASLEQLVAFLSAEGETSPPASAVERAGSLLASVNRPAGVGLEGLAARASEGVRRLVAALQFDSRYSPALAGFRGVADAVQIAFAAEGCEIDLEVTEGESGRSAVRGQIDADECEGWTVTAVAERGGASDPVPADASGGFRLELEPGVYTLVLSREGTRIEAGPIPLP